MRRRLDGLQGKQVLYAVTQAVIAVLGMSLVLWLWIQQSAAWSDWMVALSGVAIGGIVYLLILFTLRNHELRQVSSALINKLKRIQT
jgi:hypothetical protein